MAFTHEVTASKTGVTRATTVSILGKVLLYVVYG